MTRQELIDCVLQEIPSSTRSVSAANLRTALASILTSSFNLEDDGGAFTAGQLAAFDDDGKLAAIDISISELIAFMAEGGGEAYDGDPTVIIQDPTHRLHNDTQATEWDIAYTHSQAAHEAPGAAAAALVSANSYTDDEVTALKDGVNGSGDTLQKLYNMILGNFMEVTVEDITERDAYDVPFLPFNIFVEDDGDGNWALYKATSTGVAADFVKLSDPDLLNEVLTASQIKAAYESNGDTNAFTNALLAKLNGIASAATANSADAFLLSVDNHTTGSTNKLFTAAEKTKLAGIADGATGDQDLSGLVVKNANIPGATKAKITYDAKGLVTAGADLIASDIPTLTASKLSDFNAAALAAAPAETTQTVGNLINSSTVKATPIDADRIGFVDSAAGNILKYFTWGNLKTALASVFQSVTSSPVYNQSVAQQGAGFATDTYLLGSNVIVPSSIKIGSRYYMMFEATKTGAGIATPIITVRVGASGVVGDASRAVLTFLAGTAAIDEAVFEVWITFRAVGGSCIMQVTGRCTHRLSTTGFQNQPGTTVRATSASFALAAGNHVGVSVNGGASAAWTVQQVQAELSNLT